MDTLEIWVYRGKNAEFNLYEDAGDSCDDEKGKYRGTLVENQTKKYIQQTLPEIAELKAKIPGLGSDIEKGKVAIEIKEKEALQAKLEAELLEIGKGKLKYKNWESKGTRGNPLPTIFVVKKRVAKRASISMKTATSLNDR